MTRANGPTERASEMRGGRAGERGVCGLAVFGAVRDLGDNDAPVAVVDKDGARECAGVAGEDRVRVDCVAALESVAVREHARLRCDA